MSLGNSQRDLEAQEVGVMHQVSYSSSVSTFCRNEKTGIIRASQSIFSFPFLFPEKNGCPPTMLGVIFFRNFP